MISNAKTGQRVTTKWTFKADGSWRNGRISAQTVEGYEVTFDDGRHEQFTRSAFNAKFDHLYDLPRPVPVSTEGIMYEGVQAMAHMSLMALDENYLNIIYAAQRGLIYRADRRALLEAHFAFRRVKLLERDLEEAIQRAAALVALTN